MISWAAANGMDDAVAPPQRFEPTEVEASPPLLLDLTRGRIKTILWATGFRPDYSWLDVPVLDHNGNVRHDGGVVESPGMYLLGLPFLRRRKSSLIDGVGDDARDLSAPASYLDTRAASWARPATQGSADRAVGRARQASCLRRGAALAAARDPSLLRRRSTTAASCSGVTRPRWLCQLAIAITTNA
jgi:hypothetical protein